MKYRYEVFRFLRTPLLIRDRLASAFLVLAFVSAASGFDITRAAEAEYRQLLKQGEKLIKRGDFEAAEKVFQQARSLNPTHPGAKLRLAYIYVKQRRLQEAYDLSFAVAKEEPRNAHSFAVLGATLLAAGRFPESRTILYNSLQLDRKEALAWAGLGMLEFYENRINESLENLWEAVYLDSDQPDYLFTLAQVSARAERYKDAAEAYNRFLRTSRNTDDERRDRIKGLISFLRFLGDKQSLYITSGSPRTSVTFNLTGNRPVIQLRVNDRKENLRFVLDTGSGISVISEKTAKRLKVKPITRGGYAKGIGGDGRFEIVYGFLKEVQIGDIKVRNVPVYIRKFHSEGPELDGYIGLSLISKFLTTIDYGEQTFKLEKRESGNPDDKTGVSLPLRLTSSGFLSGEVQLEGLEQPLNFIVDTGASVSVISSDIAAAHPVNTFPQGARMRVVGSAGITDDVPSFLLPKVSFGSHSRKSITAIALDLDMINEASGFEQAGILGGNFLRNYRMTFDFRNSKVTFVPVVADP